MSRNLLIVERDFRTYDIVQYNPNEGEEVVATITFHLKTPKKPPDFADEEVVRIYM